MSLTNLTADEFRLVEDALRSAFPNRPDLARLVRRWLGEDLDAILAPGSLQDQITALLEWTQSRSRMDALLRGALAENPDNQALRTVAGSLGLPLPPVKPPVVTGAPTGATRLPVPALVGGALVVLALLGGLLVLPGLRGGTATPAAPTATTATVLITPTPPAAPTVLTVTPTPGSLIRPETLDRLRSRSFLGHTKAVKGVAFAPGSELLASAAWDGTIRLWRTLDGQLTQTLTGDGQWSAVAFSPDGQLVLAGGSSQPPLRTWRVADGTPQTFYEGPGNDFNEVRAAAYSPDGRIVAATQPGGQVRVWQAGAVAGGLLGEGPAAGFALAFAPTGRVLAAGEPVQLWNVDTNATVLTLEETPRAPSSITFTPDGTLLVVGYYDSTVRLYQVRDGSRVRILSGPQDIVYAVAVSPDGEIVAAGSQDRKVYLWRTRDGTLLRTLQGPAGPVSSVAFAPNGQWLAAGSDDGAVTVWGVPVGP